MERQVDTAVGDLELRTWEKYLLLFSICANVTQPSFPHMRGNDAQMRNRNKYFYANKYNAIYHAISLFQLDDKSTFMQTNTTPKGFNVYSMGRRSDGNVYLQTSPIP